MEKQIEKNYLETLIQRDKEIMDLQDKLRRRNAQIRELKSMIKTQFICDTCGIKNFIR